MGTQPEHENADRYAAYGFNRARDLELVALYRENAESLESRIVNSNRLHPELASPQEFKFWLDSFRQVCKMYADDLRHRAALIELQWRELDKPYNLDDP